MAEFNNRKTSKANSQTSLSTKPPKGTNWQDWNPMERVDAYMDEMTQAIERNENTLRDMSN